MGTPSLGVLLSLLGAGCVVDPSGFGWIPKCTNSSLWVGLLGNCSLALTGECPWKSLVVMIDHSGGLKGKPRWSHPEIVSQNPSMNQDQGTTASGLSPKTVCSNCLRGPWACVCLPDTLKFSDSGSSLFSKLLVSLDAWRVTLVLDLFLLGEFLDVS